jgi:hypothetical protein
MGTSVYFLGFLTTLLCAVLLARGYARSRMKLLLWSALCFFGLMISNALVVIDLVIFPTSVDLHLLRLATATVSMLLLLFGLIWESE